MFSPKKTFIFYFIYLVLIILTIQLAYVSAQIEVTDDVVGDVINLISPSRTIIDSNASTECTADEVLLGNTTCMSVSIFGVSGGGDANIFDQDLNTTDDVTHYNMSITNNLTIGNILLANVFQSVGSAGFLFNFIDDGSELTLNATSITDAFNVETDNSKIVLFNEPKVQNDFKVFQIFSKEASDETEFTVTKAGFGHASYFVRSLALVGNGSQIGTPFNCTTWTDNIDCRTDHTGADLYVLDDIEANGSFIGNGSAIHSLNFSLSLSELSDVFQPTSNTSSFLKYNGTDWVEYDMSGTSLLVQWNNTGERFTASSVGRDSFSLLDNNRSGIQGIRIKGNGYREYSETAKWLVKLRDCDNNTLEFKPVYSVQQGIGLNPQTDNWDLEYIVDRSQMCYNGTYDWHYQEVTGVGNINKDFVSYELIIE